MTQSQSEQAPANSQDTEGQSPATFWALVLGSMGVVFGDIGTSPLYAFKVALEAAGGSQGDVSRATVLGVLSLIL
ncbi:MAG TPA: KUP/HAK/KT family potassium transporter, partial [Methyloceanibacter sp.]|nr:KUP/HAK/KT family potassium transporter [Methyloceanibacter sp.]